MRSSLFLAADHRSRARAVAALLTVVGLLSCMAGLPTSASASFDASAPSCLPAALGNSGTVGNNSSVQVEGNGSSLQASAQTLWKTILASEAHGCGSNAPKVTFKSTSSGCGLDSVGAGTSASSCELAATEQKKWEVPGYRDQNVRFGASDFAPSVEEEHNIDAGPNGTGNPKSGEIHVIPVAEAAIAVIVHVPQGCKLKEPGTGATSLNDDASTGGPNDPTGAPTGDTYTAQTLRVHIPAQALEGIWEHKITTWGEIPTPTGGKVLAEEIEGSPTGAQAEAYTCASFPIYRIVREDTSGTSYNFKAYLGILPSSGEGGPKLWDESEVGKKNTAWPLANAKETGVPKKVVSNRCTEANQICSAEKKGGKGLAEAVNGTEGSIAYLDLATAREQGFNKKEGEEDTAYWLPLEPVNPSTTPGTVDTGVFVEPTVDPGAHFTKLEGHKKGANCEGADVRNLPQISESKSGDPTLGDWSKAIATGGTAKAIAEHPTTAYPVCAITYDLAFDDDAAAYESTTPEEEKARAVKDYLSVVVSQYAQDQLPGEADYAVLKPELLADAQMGVADIGWNKTAGSVGVKEEVKTPVATTIVKTTPPTIVPAIVPSNAFSITSAKVKGKEIVLSLELPDPGKVQVKAIGGGVTVSSVTASVSGGSGTVTLAISKAALTKLAKAKGHKLSVKITVTFTPTGGTASTQTKTLTVTQAAVTPKKKASKGKKK